MFAQEEISESQVVFRQQKERILSNSRNRDTEALGEQGVMPQQPGWDLANVAQGFEFAPDPQCQQVPCVLLTFGA